MCVWKRLLEQSRQMERFAKGLFRVRRTISLVDDDGSGKPKIRRVKGTGAKMVRVIANILASHLLSVTLLSVQTYSSCIFGSEMTKSR